MRKSSKVLGMTETPNSPGAALRLLRTSAGLTLEQVAREAGVSPTHLSRVETGAKRANPAYIGQVAEAIARHLRTTAA